MRQSVRERRAEQRFTLATGLEEDSNSSRTGAYPGDGIERTRFWTTPYLFEERTASHY